MFGQAKELNKLANAVANIKNMLDQYENDQDKSFLLVSAWICKVGVLDAITKNNWAPSYRVYVPIDGNQTKMYMTEVQMATIGRLKNKISNLYNYSFEETIDDILKGGKSFFEIDSQIPQKMKDVILNG